MEKPILKILLCAPRGFCAGVVRAIESVEKALSLYGPPVYVRHEIVHNKYVVEGLKRKGAIFVQELDEVPESNAPVIFSAHGVPKAIPEIAAKRNLFAIDATCPLVTKVHKQAEQHFKKGRHIILIGHRGHPEVIGTLGQLPEGAMSLVETIEDVSNLSFPEGTELAYVTQTTLSIDDASSIIAALRSKFPHIATPLVEDICYATTNRQSAVKSIAAEVDAMIVVGSPNSSNSQRLKEVAEREGCPVVGLVLRGEDINWNVYRSIKTLGLTAGASAPEVLVEEIIDAFTQYYSVEVQTILTADENVFFPLPKTFKRI